MIIEIPITPRTKKNSSRVVYVHGRIMVIPSKNYKEYEKNCEKYMPSLENPINYPINLKCTFYMGTKRKVDISNLFSAISDILTRYKVIEDDNRNIIVSYDGSKVYYDKEHPRTVIEITKVNDYQQW